MEFFDTIRKRGSYRAEFDQVEIPKEDLKEIVEAGVLAPSGYNHQTTSFLVVVDAQLRQELAKIAPTPAMKTAAAIIVPLSEYWQAENGLSFEIEDYACAVENVMLAITAKGYAGVWMDGQMKLDNGSERVAELLHVEEGKHVRAMIPVGKPLQQVVQREKKPLQERVRFI